MRLTFEDVMKYNDEGNVKFIRIFLQREIEYAIYA
jgi:hypothetical protein